MDDDKTKWQNDMVTELCIVYNNDYPMIYPDKPSKKTAKLIQIQNISIDKEVNNVIKIFHNNTETNWAFPQKGYATLALLTTNEKKELYEHISEFVRGLTINNYEIKTTDTLLHFIESMEQDGNEEEAEELLTIITSDNSPELYQDRQGF
jgi:hypothetical protein